MARSLAEMVWDRAGGVCEYCKMPQAFDELGFEVEHIISKKHGGQSIGPNLCLACFTCNRHKGSDIAGKDTKT
jgi:5-methylcytosine-specific restriction endonuclease McrA